MIVAPHSSRSRLSIFFHLSVIAFNFSLFLLILAASTEHSMSIRFAVLTLCSMAAAAWSCISIRRILGNPESVDDKNKAVLVGLNLLFWPLALVAVIFSVTFVISRIL